MLRCSIIRVANHPRLWTSLTSSLKPATLCPPCSNRIRHSTHSSPFRSAFRFVAFRSNNPTSDVSRILIPRLTSSTTCNPRLLQNQIVVMGIARVSRSCVAPNSVHHTASQETGVGSGRRNTKQHTARAWHALRPHCKQPSLKNAHYSKGWYTRKATILQGRPTIYYDGVSSGPHPKAHWYMLTHQCYSDTAPYWTPHRATQSSGPIPMPLQCLSTTKY